LEGTVFAEVIFTWPGVGKLLVYSMVLEQDKINAFSIRPENIELNIN
jgi:ABC-type antimicrobial peptide transport system permease subunit